MRAGMGNGRCTVSRSQQAADVRAARKLELLSCTHRPDLDMGRWQMADGRLYVRGEVLPGLYAVSQ